MERNDDLFVIAPLFDVIAAGIPDRHRARTVFAGRYRTLEGAVFEGMILRLHREMIAFRLGRHTLGKSPADEHAVVLETEVIVQVAGVVLLDDERSPIAGRRMLGRHGFWSLLRVAHAAIFGEPVRGGRRRAEVVHMRFRRLEGVQMTCRQFGQRIAASFHASQNIPVVELGEIFAGELAPGAGCRNGGKFAAAQRIRCDRRLGAVVLAPVEQHLAGAQRLLHVADHEVRMIGLHRSGEFVSNGRHLIGGLLAVEGRVEVDAFAAARHRHDRQPHVAEDLAHHPGDLRALGKPGTLPGIEVEHEPVGVPRRAGTPEPPLRNVDLECGDLAEPDQCRRVVDERVVVAVIFMRDGAALDPRRGRIVEVLLEEHLAGVIRSSDPVDPALARGRSVRRVGDEHLGDLGVVRDHVALRRSGGRVEHFVEIREGDPVAVDGDVLRSGIGCHCSSLGKSRDC